ncbi:hypothetical protein MtrunA17_Chr3g0080951 [Medicago truncatula]|uniref:Uncharacterized protein n=1 Tax=Medicago truncatula TaxID=3880 RepID=A0A396IRG2_MEDTR|nr:hypothetical protein MtrunA17_Chr3g0080951 [Medicago truncatula]
MYTPIIQSSTHQSSLTTVPPLSTKHRQPPSDQVRLVVPFVGIQALPVFYIQKIKAFKYKTMSANGDARLQSVVQRPNQDGHAASPSPAPSPRRGGSPTSSHPAVHIQDQAPFGLQQPDEVADNSTPSASWLSYLLQTLKAQSTMVEEQNQRIVELERSKKQLLHLHNASSLPRNIRGGSPRRSRSRSPRRSNSVRSPSRGRSPPRRRGRRS